MHCINAVLFPPTEEITDRKIINLPHGWKLSTIKEDEKFKNAVIVSTDYFGGPGEQHAIVIQNGVIIQEALWKTNIYHPINNALAYFGLQKDEGKDEFDTINLGHYRSNEDIEAPDDSYDDMEIEEHPTPEPDSDEADYEFALEVFKIEEGRDANMNNENDMRCVAMLQVGIRHQRLRK